LLTIGRQIERLGFLSNALAAGFAEGVVQEVAGVEALVALFDSTITFHARFQQRRDVVALADLLVLDHGNPRALAWVLQTLRGRIARLGGNASLPSGEPALGLPDPADWDPSLLGTQDAQGRHAALEALFAQCEQAARQASDALSARYFTLTAKTLRSVGT
jgi:uncharacterized alpha-E superfamily protein